MVSLITGAVLATRLALSVSALPFKAVVLRAVTLDQAAVEEAQQRDSTATRAFSSVSVKTSTNLCFSVDPLSGDFRENLTPVQLVACDAASPNQKWDVITAGKHNNVPGFALFVSFLTNASFNFDPHRAAGNQVLLFSCGRRADGGSSVTDSQLFPFSATAGAGPFALTPKNSNNRTCLTSKGAVLHQTACNALSLSSQELFTIGDVATGTPASGIGSTSTTSSPPVATSTPPPVATTTAGTKSTATVQSVSHAGGRLNPSAVAEAQQKDSTATRAFTSPDQGKWHRDIHPIISSRKCLSIDPNAGDFRQNLIPVQLKACNAADPGQKFDVITKGKHNDQPGFALVVSSLTNGCLNFDARRAPGDQVVLFSCGGRADGAGKVTDSQLFSFSASITGTGLRIPLAPKNGKGKLCLVDQSGKLSSESCQASNASGVELFTIG